MPPTLSTAPAATNSSPSLLQKDEALAANAAVELIRKGNGLVKTQSSRPNDNVSWDFLLSQLEKPATVRPLKTLRGYNTDRRRYWNPKTGQSITRTVSRQRGAPKKADYPFTKKTSTTLLPGHGKMHLFLSSENYRLGILFDVAQVHLKDEKYIWRNNALTNDKWWVGDYGSRRLSIPLATLKKELTDSGTRNQGAVSHNEILAGLSKQAARGLFATKNTLSERLNLLRIQQHVKSSIGLTLPLLIITPYHGVSIYTIAQQRADYERGMHSHQAMTKTINKFNQPPSALQFATLTRNNQLKQVCQLLETKATDFTQLSTNEKSKLLKFIIEQNNQALLTKVLPHCHLANKQSALIDALSINETAFALQLVASGATRQAYCSQSKKYALELALDLDNQPVIEALLRLPVTRHEPCIQQYFIAAIENNDYEKLRLLMQLNHLAPAIDDTTKHAALTLAAGMQDKALLMLLMQLGLNPNLRLNGQPSAIDLLLDSQCQDVLDAITQSADTLRTLSDDNLERVINYYSVLNRLSIFEPLLPLMRESHLILLAIGALENNDQRFALLAIESIFPSFKRFAFNGSARLLSLVLTTEDDALINALFAHSPPEDHIPLLIHALEHAIKNNERAKVASLCTIATNTDPTQKLTRAYFNGENSPFVVAANCNNKEMFNLLLVMGLSPMTAPDNGQFLLDRLIAHDRMSMLAMLPTDHLALSETLSTRQRQCLISELITNDNYAAALSVLQLNYSSLLSTPAKLWLDEVQGLLARKASTPPAPLNQLISQLISDNRLLFNQGTCYRQSYDQRLAGHSVIYNTLFCETRALLTGKRQLFANTRAFLHGNGQLFADTRAIMRGQRGLFANTRASFFMQQKIKPLAENVVTKPEQNRLEEERRAPGALK